MCRLFKFINNIFHNISIIFLKIGYQIQFHSENKMIKIFITDVWQKIIFILYSYCKTELQTLQNVRTSNFFGRKYVETKPKFGKTELRTLPNPGSSNQIELRTLQKS